MATAFIANHTNPGTHWKVGVSIIGNHPPKNNNTVNTDINIMWVYSAKKNIANVIAEYSTLYPDTSSDSPSGKSNGILAVSANADT